MAITQSPALAFLQSIVTTAIELQSEPNSFLESFVDDFREMDQELDSIRSVPHCDECGAIDETVEWCGGCGCCVEHCQLTDLCEEHATHILELRQIGD